MMLRRLGRPARIRFAQDSNSLPKGRKMWQMLVSSGNSHVRKDRLHSAKATMQLWVLIRSD
jgi:hypothetical protein